MFILAWRFGIIAPDMNTVFFWRAGCGKTATQALLPKLFA